jgi:hypothetical protein
MSYFLSDAWSVMRIRSLEVKVLVMLQCDAILTKGYGC